MGGNGLGMLGCLLLTTVIAILQWLCGVLTRMNLTVLNAES